MSKNSGQNTPKKLIVRKINHTGFTDIKKADELLEKYAGYQVIDVVNWPSFPYKPSVKFKIAYCQDEIWLKFNVREETIRAKENTINGDVYKDSCVEFFISPNQNDTYYNFEFNCIGVPYLAFGVPGKDRKLVNPEIVKLIKVKSSLGNSPFDEKTGGHQWELMIVIPKDCFVFDRSIGFDGLNASANFYKCGDETRIPHFVTWNPVDTETPNYHQPGYFGKLQFEN